MDEALTQFIREALSKGVAKPEIGSKLLEAGWPEDEVRTALSAWADTDFPVPVPRPKPYLSAREAFTYLVLFALLYVSAWSLGSLLFQLVNRAMPDAARHSAFLLREFRWAIATLLIAFPGYFWLSLRSYRAARQDPEKRKSKVRKWLTYLTLFVAASTLLGDLITLVYNLLEGELTIRFILKVAIVGGLAGSVFGYYLWDLKQDDLKPEEVPARHRALRVFAGAVVVSVAVSLVFGLFIAGAPGRARETSFDRIRESNLVSISGEIDKYWKHFGALPVDLVTLEGTREFYVDSVRDPETDDLYEYRAAADKSYELCATFTAPSESDSSPSGRRIRRSKFWTHGAGRTCFAIEVQERSP